MRARTLLLVLLLVACNEPEGSTSAPTPRAAKGANSIQDMESPPAVTDADRRFADVFRPLDGAWEGTFVVYADTGGQRAGARPAEVDPAVLALPPYEKQLELSVRQDYVSESPFFQRVTIRDTYADGHVEVSQGVNKVQQGKLYCVVRKPDDLVVHQGTLPAPDTIVWRRERAEPQALEWFRESVRGDTYSIVGWGYYPGDDPARTPRLYFHAVYRRP